MHDRITLDWCIGLTGGIATGKSTVAKDLRYLGYIVLQADILSVAVVAPGTEALKEICEHFKCEGNMLNPGEGTLNRRKLRDIIFSDGAERLWLERLIQPLIHEEFNRRLESLGLLHAPRLFFYENALIHERATKHNYKEVWCTYCPKHLQVKHLIGRDNITEEDAEKILAVQWDAKEKADLSHVTLSTYGLRPITSQIDQALDDLRNYR